MQTQNSRIEENHISAQLYTDTTAYIFDETIPTSIYWDSHVSPLPQPPDHSIDGSYSAADSQFFDPLAEHSFDQVLGIDNYLNTSPETTRTEFPVYLNH